MLGLSAAAGVGVSTWHGTRDGGDFEVSMVFVYGHDGRRFHSWELYDLDQLDAARARFAELSRTPTPSEPISDGTTRGAHPCVHRAPSPRATGTRSPRSSRPTSS